MKNLVMLFTEMSNSLYGKIVSFAHERIAYKVIQLNMIERKKQGKAGK